MAFKSRFIRDQRERDHIVNQLAEDDFANKVALKKYGCRIADNLMLISILRFCFDFYDTNYRAIADQFGDFLHEGAGNKVAAYVNFINNSILIPNNFEPILRDSNRQFKTKQTEI